MTFVVVACPIRNRAWMVERHHAALVDQTRPPDRILYVEGDSTDDTLEKLCALPDDVEIDSFDTGSPYWSRSIDGQRYTGDHHAHLAKVYNRCIDEALRRWPQATHVWMIDSDVVPEKDCLELLLAADKDVVSAVVRNSPRSYNFMCGLDAEGEPRRVFSDRHHDLTKREKPFEVTFLSACTLIRRGVLERDPSGVPPAVCECDDDPTNCIYRYPEVRYAPHPRSHDFPFCRSIQEAGYTLWIEPRARTAHYYHGEGTEPLR